MPSDNYFDIVEAAPEGWYRALKNAVVAIEAGEIPAKKDLFELSPDTIGMITEIVRARRLLAKV